MSDQHSGPGLPHTYRADIDGLRAIAVLLVVAFHAFPTVLSGGFIGVDIFFVISGYLISTIIFSSLVAGEFSFIEFYSRRIRRIFPALLLVLAVCFVVGWQVLLAGEYAQLGRHIAAGAGFISNLVLWSESGYFDNASETKPLLHLWSLGIEEQFYIVWPLLLWCAYKFRLHFFQVIWCALLVSFSINIFLIYTSPVSAFYLPQSRFWELLVGAALRLMNGTSLKTIGRESRRNEIALTGALLIAVSVCILNKSSMFPGWFALLPVCGAAFLIATPNAWLNRKILTHRMLVKCGLISYPLYLWHWPLLSFARILRNGEPSPVERFLWVLLAIILAYGTTHYYERWLRYRGKWVTVFLMAAMMALGALGWNVFVRDGLDFRYWKIIKHPPEMVRDFTKWEDKGMYPTGTCDPAFIYPNARICLQSQSAGSADTIVFGDSHAFHAYWGIAGATRYKDHVIKLMGRGGCNFFVYNGNADCARVFESQVDWIADSSAVKNVFVVHHNVIQNTTSAEDLADYRSHMESMFERLVRSRKHVIYLYSVPEDRINPELCGSELPWGRKADLSTCNFPLGRELEIQKSYRKLVREVLEKYPSVEVFDPAGVLCERGECRTVRDGRPLWMDSNHISESASYIQGDAIAKAISLR